MRLSRQAHKQRVARFKALCVVICLIAVYWAFRGSYKGYDETRIERYQHYTFYYENEYLDKIMVNSNVFNVTCDKRDYRYEQDCVITSKAKMREFKALVNR